MTPERWRRVEEVFNAAVELPKERRSAFVHEACGSDLELRREVESLLASSGPAEDFLDRPVISLREPPSPELGPGSRVGRYRLLHRLGEGGMGVVYLAVRDDREYEQQVAIKLLNRGTGHEEIVQRFRRERQILASLDHPRIARLLDGGTTAGGHPYFVLEYVEGEPIDRWCDARELGSRERIGLVLDVCSAVHFLHQNLILHRDLKPGNILVKADGTPKLLDLGIAKLLAPESGVREPLTALGAAPMTVPYASPEQVRGEPLTTASDVYALGVLLYELLSGWHPYRDTTSLQEEIEQICRGEPEPPSRAVRRREVTPRTSAPENDPLVLGRRLAGDLDAIVLKALENEPRRRYASAEQLAEDLRRYLAGQPVSARRPTLVYRGWKFIRRHAAAVAAVVLVVVVLAGLGVRLRVLRDRAVAQRQRAESLAVSLTSERDRAQQVSSFLVDLFRRANPRVTGAEEVTARQLLEEGVATIRGRLADQPEDRAALLSVMGRAWLGLGLPEQAQPLLEESVELRRSAAATPGEMATGWVDLGHVLQTRGESARAEELYRKAVALLRGKPEAEAVLAVAVNSLAGLLEDRGEPAAAEKLYREALELRLQRYGETSEKVANSWNNLAACLHAQSRHVEAAGYCRRALELRRRLHGDVSYEVAHTTNNCAAIAREAGDLAAAEELFRESLAIRCKLYDPRHPEVATVLNNLAFLLFRRGELTEAESLYGEALDIFGERLGPEATAAGVVLRNQAALWLEMGRFTEAEAAARRAVEIFRSALPAGHWRIADGESVLGGTLAAQGRRAEAEPLLRQSHAALVAAQGEGSWRAREAAARLGRVRGGQR